MSDTTLSPMSPIEVAIRARARRISIAKHLAVRISKDGTTGTEIYFQTREAFENFMNRALHQGYTVEALTCPSVS